ncbi:uncharacterized protein LY89DRAFT_268543 [Mollisia scopiformis]|uniref:Uncharacterized protein n=1 Tax=Mollisia scopiformis TaxID=149040 RepID=A0A132BCA5_MOLSC|nr:uncharacterized protein LY89DRAFT_268543 [Mollisia scopiformis]KUJ10045.1 hypothetical protein LY89DRAFT_268543 [Mollisia scopiformis]
MARKGTAFIPSHLIPSVLCAELCPALIYSPLHSILTPFIPLLNRKPEKLEMTPENARRKTFPSTYPSSYLRSGPSIR